jgi:hypothetical protein
VGVVALAAVAVVAAVADVDESGVRRIEIALSRETTMKMFSLCRCSRIVPCVLAVLFAAAAGSGCASPSSSSLPEQKDFSSPDVAAKSLVDALRKDDEAGLKKILGPAGKEILSSGDKVADEADGRKFLALYDARHRIQQEKDGTSTLIVGDTDWPFPVPIVKAEKGGGFVFDTEKGRDEILNRRIGRNELDAQQVCLAIADAQRDYVAMKPMGGDLPEYAQKLISDPGKKNGLYWPTAAGEPPSPVGPFVARAAAEGYQKRESADSPPPPYHGYCYRLLTAQGPHAPGGAMNYLVNGHLIGGFAVVAYPAEYGNSGIMTFLTNRDGVVYQRDLGDDTEKIAQSMKEFDPGPEWSKSADSSSVTQAD